MLSEGESLPALKYILLTASEVNQNFSHFMDAVLNGLFHGQVMRRDQRISMQTLMEAKKSLNPNVLKNGKIANFEIHKFINRYL